VRADFFSSLETPVNFCLIRHGQSEGNAAGIMQGREEYPLSETGRLQAAERGRSLKTILSGPGKTLLFSSPLDRAMETAEIIATEAAISRPVCMEELIEIGIGIWSGKIMSQVKDEDPEHYRNFVARSWDAIPEAESSSSLYSRALLAWAALRDAAVEHNAKRVIAVTHGGFIQWLLKSSFGSRTWLPLFPSSNCGLYRLFVEPDRNGVYMCWEEINSALSG